jgi:hypothetical protein
MIKGVTITERGPAPRNFRRLFGNLQKEAWQVTAEAFHEIYRDLRFTEAHGRAAGYAPRKGEGTSGKAFWRSYAGRKRLKFGHSRPLEWSGETRRAVASASITTTRNRADIAYAGARKLNFRHPKSEIRMSEEFTRLLPAEAADLGRRFDRELDRLLKVDGSVSHMSLT